MESNRHSVLMSIRPKYVAKILRGSKKVELRRSRMKIPNGTTVFLYSSGPVSSIVATAVIREIEECLPEELWALVGEISGIQRREFEEYFVGARTGYALHLQDVQELEIPISLSVLRKATEIEPPQSFRYLSKELVDILMKSSKMAGLTSESPELMLVS